MAQHAQLSRRDAAVYVTLDSGRIERIQIGERRVLVGSDPRNDICLANRNVQPRHASIYFAGGEHILSCVSDGSTLVNGSAVARSTPLENGDVIWIGGRELRFIRLQSISTTTLQLSICRRNEPHDILITQRPEVRIGYRIGEVRVNDEFIADPHCVIENPFPGLLYVTNLDQVRGTKLNGVRVTEREPLSDGDTLSLGTTTIHLNVMVGQSMPKPGESIAMMQRSAQPALVLPEATDWDDPGVTQLLDESLLQEAHERRLHGAAHEVGSSGAEKTPYYLPKGTVFQQAQRRNAGPNLADLYEGVTREIPKVSAPSAGRRAQYYLPEEER